MLVFAFYLASLSVVFMFFPNPVIMLLGFEETSDVWIRILGYLLGVLAFFYLMAYRENATSFYRWSVYARLPVLPVFLLFVLLSIAPPILLLFGVIDTLFALWTGLALKNEHPTS